MNAITRREILVVDSTVANYETLLQGLDDSIEVILLHGDDGLAELADALAGRSGIDSLHILSHGSAGQLQLGDSTLDTASLVQYQPLLATIGAALAPEGDILLYGCEVAASETGVDFIGRLAQATGADVAGSDDLTGSARLGGDWVLEVQQGHIEAVIPISPLDLSGFAGVLANTLPFTRDIDSFVTLGASSGAQSAAGSYATNKLDGISLEAWVCLDSTAGAHHALFNGNGASSGYGFYLINGTVNVLLGAVGWIVGSTGSSYNAGNATVLSAGRWTHITATRDTTDPTATNGWKLYVDGKPLATQFNPAGGANGDPNPVGVSSYVQIGNASAADAAGLSISEARIWEKALTQTEIQVNMSGTVATNASGLVGYWKLEQSSGSSFSDIQINKAQQLHLPASGNITWVASTVGTTNEDTALTGRLAGGDLETGIDYAVASNPTQGTVDISANGAYTYTPAADYNGSDSFTFTVNDGTAASEPRTVNLTINAVEDAPAITAGTITAFTEQTPTAVAPTITISDAEGNWNGGSLKVQITGASNAADSLRLPTSEPASGVWVNGIGGPDYAFYSKSNGANTYLGTADASGVTGGTAWTFNFGSNATSAFVQEVARAIQFANDSNEPVTAARTVTFTATDATSASASATQTVTVTTINDAPQVTNRIDPAIKLSGATTSYASFPDGSVTGGIDASIATSQAFTLETWVKFTDLDGVQFIAGKAVEQMELHTNGSALRFIPIGGAYIDTGNVLVTGEWMHIAATYNAVTDVSEIYINGVKVATQDNNGTTDLALADTTNPYQLGLRSGGALPLNGDIAEYRIWNDVRTAAEISGNLNASLQGTEANLVALWKLDEANGTILADSTTNFNGTLNNGNWTTRPVNGGLSVTYTEDAAPVSVFSGATVSTVESGQLIKALTFTVSNVSDTTETLNIDGTAIALANGSGTTTTNRVDYSVSVNSGTATVSLTHTGLTEVQAAALINGIAYSNSSQNPSTTNTRVVTLTQMTDTGGGSDTATLSLASTITVAAVNDAPTIAGGIQVASFDGSDDYIDLPDITIGGDLTLEAWIKVDAYREWSRVIEMASPVAERTDNITLAFYGPNRNLAYEVNNDGLTLGLITSSIEVPLNEWTHVAVVHAGSTATFYVNGVASGSGTVGAATSTPREDAWIARSHYSHDKYFDGQMRDVRIWDVARSDSEISNNRNATLAGNETGLTAWYPLNGTANNGTSPALNGTPMNGTQFLTNVVPPGAVQGNEDSPIALAGLVFADVDASSLLVQLSVDNGTLSLATTTGLTFSTGDGTADAALTFSGAIADINTAMATLSFQSDAHFNGSATLTYSISDQGATGTGGALSASGTRSITVNAVNDNPAITSLPASITVTEDTASNVDLSAATFADVDSGSNSITLTIAAGAGTLAASTGGSVTVSGSASGTLTLSGTAANIDAYLNTASNIKYTGASNASGTNATTLTLTANDGGNTGAGGGSNVSLGSVNVNITAVNDAPTLSANGSSPTFTEDGGAVTLFNTASASTVESGQTLKALTLTVTNVSDTTESLGIDGSTVNLTHGASGTTTTNGLNYSVSVSVTGGTATVTLSKDAGISTADMETLVDGITYNNSDQSPTTASNREVTLTRIQDSGGTDNDGVDTASPNIVTTLTLVGVNDAPVITSGATGSVAENAAISTVIYTATAIDPDTDQTLTYSLSGTDAGLLNINASTGAVTLKASADFETKPSYSFNVIATDNGAGALNDTQAVTVSVTDVNEDTGGGDPTPPPPITEDNIPPPDEWTDLPDDDGDGVPESIENLVPSLPPGDGSEPVAGDGNGDGVPDQEQSDVASIPFRDTDTVSQNPNAPVVFVTLVADSEEGTPDGEGTITTARQLDAPPVGDGPGERPTDLNLPLGLISFTATTNNPGAPKSFSLFVPSNLEINGYWKPTATGWVNLASPEYGGQLVTVGDKTRLDFVIEDGGPFDTNPAPGIIGDPGGPGFMQVDVPLPSSDCPYDPFKPDADGDGMPDTIEAGQGNNPSLKDNTVFTDNTLFAQQLYRDILGREGDTQGVSYWAQALAEGQTRAELVTSFINGAEFDANAGAIARLYHATLGRSPDFCGFNYWLTQSLDGLSAEQMGDAFLQSPELVGSNPDLTNEEFVDLLYLNVLGREADPDGKTYWLDQMAQGMSRGSVLYEFAQSEEYKTSLEDEVAIDMLYLGLLDRAPDQGGWDFWHGQYAQYDSTSDFYDAAALQQTEYHDRFLPAEAEPVSLTGVTAATGLVGL